jgi:hypothetical protein
MADSWLIMAIRVKGYSAVDLKNSITQGTLTKDVGLRKRFFSTVIKLLNGIRGGTKRANMIATILDTSFTASTGNIACTQANAANDFITFTYGGKTVEIREGIAGENGFARGASNTTCAANLAATLNAHPILSPLILATPSVGNCALAAKVPTCLLQDMAMTTSDGTAYALTQLTGGNEGAAQFIPIHFSTGQSI